MSGASIRSFEQPIQVQFDAAAGIGRRLLRGVPSVWSATVSVGSCRTESERSATPRGSNAAAILPGTADTESNRFRPLIKSSVASVVTASDIEFRSPRCGRYCLLGRTASLTGQQDVSYHLKTSHRLSNQNRPGLSCVVYLTSCRCRKLPARRRRVLFRCGRAAGSSFR